MICVIPARSGSKSIPHKNIKSLGGKPLLVWSIESALQCGLEPYVSSDSREYLDIAMKAGASGLVRPEHLAQDSTTTFEVLADAVPKLISSNGPQDSMILMQATSPFRKREDVLMGIRKFEQGGYSSMISASKIPTKYHPEEAIILKDRGYKMATGVEIKNRKVRRQDYGPAYVPTGSFYVIRTSNILEGNLYGDRPGIYRTEETVNINGPEDWAEAELLCGQK